MNTTDIGGLYLAHAINNPKETCQPQYVCSNHEKACYLKTQNTPRDKEKLERLVKAHLLLLYHKP